ncbi:MAG: thiamine diphosphokinase [Chloroflexota bacterium]
MPDALIVADGDVPSRAAIDRLVGNGAPADLLIIGADGGALKAAALGLRPNVVVGDTDSLSDSDADKLRAEGVEVLVYPRDKDESDTELAVREALHRGAERLVIVGAFGGRRFEHALANVLLMTLPELRGRDACLADGASVLRVLFDGEHVEITGQPGDYVSLLPLTEQAVGVSTDGLAYPLSGATLSQGPTRGLSNELSGVRASVSLDAGRLAVIHTRSS